MIYNYCTNAHSTSRSSRPKRPGGHTQTNQKSFLHGAVDPVGEELHTKLKDYLKTYLEQISQVRSVTQESS